MILDKKSLTYLGLLAVLFVCAVLLLGSTVSDIVRQRKVLQGDVARISEDFIRQPSLKEVERNIDKREKDVEDVSGKFFAPVTDEFEFVKSLENLAGGEISQKIKFDINKKTEEGGYVRVPLEIAAEADFAAILGYIEKLEKLNYFFEIESVSLDGLRSGGTDTAEVGASIKGSVYWF